jgi:hypothetical protein
MLLRDQAKCHRAECRHSERAGPPLARFGMRRRLGRGAQSR